jgi:hypothetical protein
MEAAFCVEALEEALAKYGKPESLSDNMLIQLNRL